VHDYLLQGNEIFWSGNVSTPNILDWTASHSKKIGLHIFLLQIGVHEAKSWSAFSLTQKLWSGKVSTPNILEWKASHSQRIGVHTFPFQIGVHEVKSWSAFSLTLPVTENVSAHHCLKHDWIDLASAPLPPLVMNLRLPQQHVSCRLSTI
jgi:hypothetical protein